ncbi:MAG: SRPBCC family protein [Vicinamibacteraceae bacterium]
MPLSAWLLASGARPSDDLLDLRSEVVVPVPLDDAFAFFADAWNLERITPPWLNFRVRTPRPLAMREGALLDYRIRLHGLPIPWRTRIDVWEPGVRFVDRQVIGPYRWWRHEHRFEAVAGGTRVLDHVEYLPRFAWLSRAWVRRDVERIFAYRREALLRQLTNPSSSDRSVAEAARHDS